MDIRRKGIGNRGRTNKRMKESEQEEGEMPNMKVEEESKRGVKQEGKKGYRRRE